MTYKKFNVTPKEAFGKNMFEADSKIYGWMGIYKSIFAAQDAIDKFYEKNKISFKEND
jgi:hypothetical protein